MKNPYTLIYSFIVLSNYLQFYRVQNPYMKDSMILEQLSEEQYQIKRHMELNWDCDHIQKKPYHLAISY